MSIKEEKKIIEPPDKEATTAKANMPVKLAP